jgi:hypothetical protein
MLNKMIAGILICIVFHSVSMAALSHENNTFKKLSDVAQIDNLVVVGDTTFSVLFWDIYKSKLQTTAGHYPLREKQGSILYEINYLADITAKELIQRTVEQWQHLGINPEIYEVYLSDLERIWPDINDGDTLSLLIHKGCSTFYFNEVYVGVIESPEFGQFFLDIWLSENTSEPVLRDELLGVNLNE